VALGINCHGQRAVLGMCAGTGGEGANAWMGILAEVRNRGVENCCVVACDGLKGPPEAIGEIWPKATVRLCVVHLVRHCGRRRRSTGEISKDLREVYAAPTEAAATARFAEFEQAGGQRYPAIIRLWRNASDPCQRNWDIEQLGQRLRGALLRQELANVKVDDDHSDPRPVAGWSFRVLRRMALGAVPATAFPLDQLPDRKDDHG
jgi:hypothetical protein